MVLTTTNTGALIPGRVRLTTNKGAKMPEIKKIKITRNTVAGGKAVEVDDVLTVSEDITESDARYFTQIKKAVLAVEVDPEETTKTPAPKDMKVAELQELLDKLEVEYDAKALKKDLVALVEANTEDPPGEE